MAIAVTEALQLIENIHTTRARETLCIEEALGRISAQEYRANIDLPSFNNSAMDGFAVRLEDAGKGVKVIGTILAGSSAQLSVTPGNAVKIMTGAKIPEGCEAVVPIEDVEFVGESVKLPSKITPQANMRLRGEDIKAGQTIIERGEYLSSYKIGLLASQGYSYIEVYRPLRVAIFATGHELKMHYESLQNAQIFNSNTPSLLARCKELGCEVTFIGKIEDNPQTIKEAIANAKDADIIITSGGVSVGEADFTKEAFKDMGMQVLFSKIDIKPGKPTTLGKIGDTYVLNLPGNPLAAILNFELFGRFLINRLSGRKDPYIKPIKTVIAHKLTLKPGRNTIIPGTFDGATFYPLEKRGPGMVRPASLMDGFIITKKDASQISKEVLFIPLANFTASKMYELFSG